MVLILIYLSLHSGHSEWKAPSPACQVNEFQGWLHEIL